MSLQADAGMDQCQAVQRDFWEALEPPVEIGVEAIEAEPVALMDNENGIWANLQTFWRILVNIFCPFPAQAEATPVKHRRKPRNAIGPLINLKEATDIDIIDTWEILKENDTQVRTLPKGGMTYELKGVEKVDRVFNWFSFV